MGRVRPPSWVVRLRKSRWAGWDRFVRQRLSYNIMIVSATLYAVFIGDITLAALPKSADPFVDALTWACFVIFCVDISAATLFESDYPNTLIFYLDIIATASMPLTLLGTLGGDSSSLRLGRLTRLARVLRIFRIMRLAKVATKASSSLALKQAHDKRENAKKLVEQAADDSTGVQQTAGPSMGTRRLSRNTIELLKTNVNQSLRGFSKNIRSQSTMSSKTNLEANADTEEDASKSNVDQKQSLGHQLVGVTTTKIIFMVLFLVSGVELLGYNSFAVGGEAGLTMLHQAYPYHTNTSCFDAAGPATTQGACKLAPCCDGWSQLLDIYDNGVSFDGADITVKAIRVRGTVFLDDPTDDIRKASVAEYTIGDSKTKIDMTESVRLAAFWSLGQTSLICLVLVLFPFIFNKDVLRIVVTPLEIIFDRVEKISADPFLKIVNTKVAKKKNSKSYEVVLIGAALSKLTKLLQIGLGPAASAIITSNLDLGAGKFSALTTGARISAIFAFCDIRCFTDLCELLQEECTLFVNSIARIVSEQTHKSKGAVNKNIGDAFLMAWKYGRSSTSTVPINPNLKSAAEESLTACVNIVEKVQSDQSVQAFAKLPMVQKKMGQGFAINVGCGLHVGWAIEGAVGSEQKIDATYLSPNVNLSARLQSGTKQYKVQLLMSHWFHEHLSEETQRRCRRVDVAMVKGSAEPMTMITYEHGAKDVAEQICAASIKYFEAYVAGDWAKCRDEIKGFLEGKPGDGPAQVIYEYIKESDFKAPPDWTGCRKLKSK